jgi:hypothetical protein
VDVRLVYLQQRGCQRGIFCLFFIAHYFTYSYVKFVTVLLLQEQILQLLLFLRVCD